jgi:hypothetical protein
MTKTSKDYNSVCGMKGEWFGVFPISVVYNTKWICDECGNCFSMCYSDVQQDHWCPDCGHEKSSKKQRLTAEDYNSVCGMKGEWFGILPTNARTKTRWICYTCGNCFLMSYDNVQHGQFCPKCRYEKSAEKQRLTEKDYNLVCGQKGEWFGILPKRNNDLTRWICYTCGNCFPMRYAVVQTGSWCPDCAKSRTEKLCRQYFEEWFSEGEHSGNYKFENTKPEWLVNPKTKCKMEIDGYNPNCKCCFEYNGEQHYKFIKYWHKTQERFLEQQERDRVKYQLIYQRGLRLCIIPPEYNCYDPNKLRTYIRDWLSANDFITITI